MLPHMRHGNSRYSRRRHLARPVALFGLISLALLAAACGGPEKGSGTAAVNNAPGASSAEADPNAPREYASRGRVKRLSAEGKEIFIHHEAIPEFIGMGGNPEPMKSMTMPFPVDPQLTREIAIGDAIQFRFRIDWDGAKPLELIAIEKLPAETRLAFEKDQP